VIGGVIRAAGKHRAARIGAILPRTAVMASAAGWIGARRRVAVSPISGMPLPDVGRRATAASPLVLRTIAGLTWAVADAALPCAAGDRPRTIAGTTWAVADAAPPRAAGDRPLDTIRNTTAAGPMHAGATAPARTSAVLPTTSAGAVDVVTASSTARAAAGGIIPASDIARSMAPRTIAARPSTSVSAAAGGVVLAGTISGIRAGMAGAAFTVIGLRRCLVIDAAGE
jgi:hypothetical protein